VHTLLLLVHGPPPHPAPALPCLALPALPFARMLGVQEGECSTPPPSRSQAAVPSAQAAPHSSCTPSTSFARMLGAGQTERPPSLSVHKQAPLPGQLLLPLAYVPPTACTPSPILCINVGGMVPTHPLPFASLLGLHPTPPACTPPPLHACWGQGRQSSPPSLSICEQAPLPWLLPIPPGLCTTRRAHALPLCMHAGEAQGTVPPPPVCRQAPPPRLHISPLHLGAPPPLHALLRTCRKRRKDRGACKGRATQGVSHARRPTCQGRTEQKGTVRKGWGHRMMGSATQAANGGGAKGTQAGRGATQVRGAACERSGGHNRAGGWHMNGRWHTPFLHPCAQ